MKFITEDDLRDLYRKEPFAEYVTEPGTRLTPGARQFLADRQIFLPDDDPAMIAKIAAKARAEAAPKESIKILCSKKLTSRLKSVEALFLAIAEDLLGRDVLLTQKLISLKKTFTEIISSLDGGKASEPLICESCTGICEENFSQDLGDCFEITEFHIQLAKGKEIISLHRLRCALREIEFDILESFDGSAGKAQCEEVLSKVNQIVNTLSLLICYAAGGEKCQRKM
jgi:ethanolamine utilization cobalamin adenosyltransferase